jgi:hypothetical protein
LNGIVCGCRDDGYQRGRDQFAANIVLEGREDCERSGQHVRVGVRNDDVELVIGLIGAIPDEVIVRLGNPPEVWASWGNDLQPSDGADESASQRKKRQTSEQHFLAGRDDC